MHEIEFRVWDKIRKYYMERPHLGMWSSGGACGVEIVDNHSRFIPEQYTTLKDVKGQKAYHHDIIKTKMYDILNEKPVEVVGEIIQQKAGWWFDAVIYEKDFSCYLGELPLAFTIIGNTKEHPEILEDL